MERKKFLSYYTYSTPVVYLKWNNHIQPGRYYSAVEAHIAYLQGNFITNKSDIWEICTPDATVNINEIGEWQIINPK
uniref:Uncharacterized protein n=1 Tax=viral metagenome TaxID=1070528 RepID=A0A6H2A4K6_9ZZZZ